MRQIPFDDEATEPVLDLAGNEERPRYLPGILLQRFFADQWQHAEQYGRLACAPEDDPDYQLIMSSLGLTKRVRLLGMPWVRSRDWTLIDLREHFDADLFDQMMAAFREVFPTSESDVPTERLRQSLQAPVEEQTGRVFHVVVALEPPAMDQLAIARAATDTLSLEIAAVLVLDYFTDINCARIAYDFVRHTHASSGAREASGIVTDLLDKGRAVVQRTATAGGHLGGCSAILASVDLGEERILGERCGMVPCCTSQTADTLVGGRADAQSERERDLTLSQGFLKVPKLHVTQQATDTLLVLDSPIIPVGTNALCVYLSVFACFSDSSPSDEHTGKKFLPARLLLEFVREVVSNPRVLSATEALLGSR